MTLNRIYVGEQTDNRLRTLKARTGFLPNHLCRLGFCWSLDEPGIPDPSLYADGQVREFNRYTLTGPYDSLFFAALRQRLTQDNLDIEEHLAAQFKAHICRGVNLLYPRLKGPEDLADIVLEAQERLQRLVDRTVKEEA